MPTYTQVRKTKWFTMLGFGPAGSYVEATYNGQDPNGRPDPIGEGTIGKTYVVMMLEKNGAILAPCPDFCNDGETIKLSAKDQALVDKKRKQGNVQPVIHTSRQVTGQSPTGPIPGYHFIYSVPVCHPYSESEFLTYVAAVLNRKKLPFPAWHFIYKESGIYRLDDDIFELIEALKNLKAVTTNQKIAIYAYFALAFYYRYITLVTTSQDVQLIQNIRKSSHDNISKALKLNPHLVLKSFLIGIRKEMMKPGKSLVLISYDFRQPKDFGISLRDIKGVDVKVVKKVTDKELKKHFNEYTHVLMFGHGDEDGTYIGDTKLTDRKLITAIVKNTSLHTLGIFSCQENIYEMEVKHHVDYFMTNSHTCSEKTSKGFASAYFTKLIHSQDIVQAYDHASRAMLFRIIAEFGFHLYQGGMRIR